jgi:hypothetical protein
VCRPWFRRTAQHQSDTTVPQNGKIIPGFAVRDNFAFFGFDISSFARFAFAATERFVHTFTLSKSNSFNADSRLQFNTPAESSSDNTARAKLTPDSRIPRSTDALNTKLSDDILFAIFLFVLILTNLSLSCFLSFLPVLSFVLQFFFFSHFENFHIPFLVFF